ncbi:MAG: RsmE family RNA methyltransferase [Candidatus Brachytrichaceae bacterium NZ_4S206]
MSGARRLPVDALPAEGGPVRLGPAAAHHAKVLRLEVGDAVVLFDGRGNEAEGRVARVEGSAIDCEVGAPRTRGLAGPAVVLCQCLPKGGKLEDIVRATTELGVSAVHLVASERSVPRLDEGRAEKKLERLVRVAQEAARQSGRSDVPELLAPASLREVLARAPSEAAKVALVPGATMALADAVGAVSSGWVLVGPEGGLAPAEVALAESLGFAAVGLGPTVLRVETAAPVAVALLRQALGGMRPVG